MAVHPTAIVEDGAILGAGVEIGPYCVVGAGAKLGEGVRLLSHVVVSGLTEIGARTVIHPHAVIGGESQIHHNDASGTRLVVGEDCVLRECVTLNLGSKKGHNVTTIGNRVYMMAYSHVGHDCIVGDGCTFANGAQLAGHVTLGDGVILGGLSAVQQFGRIGRCAMLGGLAGANLDVIPFGIAFGSHAHLAGLNLIGMKRRSIPRASIHAARGAYKLIFLSDEGSQADRVKKAREQWGAIAEVAEILDFIEAPAKRKISPARRHGQDMDSEA